MQSKTQRKLDTKRIKRIEAQVKWLNTLIAIAQSNMQGAEQEKQKLETELHKLQMGS